MYFSLSLWLLHENREHNLGMNVAWQQNVASLWHSSMEGQHQQQQHQFNVWSRKFIFWSSSIRHVFPKSSTRHVLSQSIKQFRFTRTAAGHGAYISAGATTTLTQNTATIAGQEREMSLPIQDCVIGSFPPLLKIDFVLLIHCLVIVLRTSFLGNIRQTKQTQQGTFTILFYDIFHKKLQLQRLRLYPSH